MATARDGSGNRMTRLPNLGPRGEGWVLIQLVLLALVVVLGVTSGGEWDQFPRVVTTGAGGLLLVAGGVLATWGMLDLRDALTPLPYPRDGAVLVERGAYRVVRHPIYGGLVLGAVGYGLLVASLPAIVSGFVLLGFFRLKSAREELWLLERHPAYDDYRRHTRRLIPFAY